MSNARDFADNSPEASYLVSVEVMVENSLTARAADPYVQEALRHTRT